FDSARRRAPLIMTETNSRDRRRSRPIHRHTGGSRHLLWNAPRRSFAALRACPEPAEGMTGKRIILNKKPFSKRNKESSVPATRENNNQTYCITYCFAVSSLV